MVEAEAKALYPHPATIIADFEKHQPLQSKPDTQSHGLGTEESDVLESLYVWWGEILLY